MYCYFYVQVRPGIMYRIIFVCCCSELISTMDMKCPAATRCWYCKNLCDNCLSLAGFGSSLEDRSSTGISLKFCSQKCANYFSGSEEKPMSLETEIFPLAKRQSSSSVELLRITGTAILKKDEGIKVFCSVNHGFVSDAFPVGRFYLLCQLRSLFSQKVVEMFVDKNAIPENPLPHTNSPGARDMVTSFKQSNTVTWIVISALQQVQKLIQSKSSSGQVDLNLSILTTHSSVLFEGAEDPKAFIKVRKQF